MKIAVPTRSNRVDDHFGHCEEYTIFTVDEKLKIEKTETEPSPRGCGCKSDVAGILRHQGVSVMLAGNMGQGAFNLLKLNGIEVVRGCSGNVYEVTELFLNGHINDSGNGCMHHEHHEGHQCNH